MIKEAYCSFEVSKLLKEKGFNERSSASYDLKGQLQEGYGYWNKTLIWYAAPTHQMAMAWLREVHNLCIAPYTAAYRYGFTIDKTDTGSNIGNETKFYPDEEFETYEDVVEAALKYCLKNLI